MIKIWLRKLPEAEIWIWRMRWRTMREVPATIWRESRCTRGFFPELHWMTSCLSWKAMWSARLQSRVTASSLDGAGIIFCRRKRWSMCSCMHRIWGSVLVERWNLTDWIENLRRSRWRSWRGRAVYQEYHTGHAWGSRDDYDLCMDTGKIGVETAAELIAVYYQKKTGGRENA